MPKSGAGALREKVTFQAFVDSEDEWGNVTQAWVDQFEAAASIEYLRGGETVLASRLTARQPAVLTIRSHTAARNVKPDWRVRNSRTGEQFAIRELPREAKESRGYLQMLIEAGVAPVGA